MSTASFAHPAPFFQQAWNGIVVAFDAIVSAKYNKQQIEPVQRLLNASNACETSNPARSDALRAEAASLIH